MSPPTETNYTLISARHGWRLKVEHTPEGRRVTTWRCPQCWQAYKHKDGTG